MKTNEITETKTVWVAWINTDLTEGRGQLIPLCVSDNKSTAIRIGRGQDVQGCDAHIGEDRAYKIDGKWVGPMRLAIATKEDDSAERKRIEREAILEKAEKLGMTKEELLKL